MKKQSFPVVKTIILSVLIGFISNSVSAQQTTSTAPSEFWKKVQFGGGVTLNIGSGFTNVGVAPSMLYNVNEFFSVGTGLQVNYVSATSYSSIIYGASITALANPIESIQLSVDLEQLKVDSTTKNIIPNNITTTFWNTALFLGAGYRTNNITAGVKYNVLHDPAKSIYTDAFMPFVRVYF